MTRPTDLLFDERVAEWLDGDPDRAPGDALEMVLTTFPSVAQQRGVHRMPRRFPTMSTPIRFATAAVIGVLAIGGAVYVTRPGQPAVAGPAPAASVSASPSPAAAVAPSAMPTATPSPTPPPILWTQASLKEDWPAPVRAEPAGSPILVPIPVNKYDGGEGYLDPLGDTGSDVLPWVDIRKVTVTSSVYIHRVSSPPRGVDPTEQWIAYGVVFDDDRDGVPDWRFGMDNRPGAKDEVGPGTRAWRTDLHTGRTESHPPHYNGAGGLLDSYWDYHDKSATFAFGGEVPGGGTAGKVLDVPFYVWASVIQDGRVVATDYAPDVGWLDPGSGPQGERLPDPTPSPGPTPRVADDPDVPGGRLWTVTVVNKSARPATFVVAEMTATGRAGRPVGIVTPSIVLAGATTEVTFALPAEGSSGSAIFANPGPDIGPMFMGSDVPRAGEIRIGADGNVGWLSP